MLTRKQQLKIKQPLNWAKGTSERTKTAPTEERNEDGWPNSLQEKSSADCPSKEQKTSPGKTWQSPCRRKQSGTGAQVPLP